MAERSAWERTVELTIAIGERVLAPIERFIGRRSLVGDETFFPTDRFPWIARRGGELDDDPRGGRAAALRPRAPRQLPGHLQGPDRDHRRRPLEDVLPLRLRLRSQARRRDVPAHGRADARDPGHDDGDVLDPLPAQAHPRPPRPLQGRAALPPRPDRAARCASRAGSGSARTSATGRRVRAWSSTTRSTTRSGTTPTRRAWCCSWTCCAPSPLPGSQINRAIVKAIGYSPFVLDAKRNQEAWERRYRARRVEQDEAAT